MREIPEEVLYDLRLIERYITKGYITREQVNELLAKTSDASDLGERIGIEGSTADGSGAAAPAEADAPKD